MRSSKEAVQRLAKLLLRNPGSALKLFSKYSNGWCPARSAKGNGRHEISFPINDLTLQHPRLMYKSSPSVLSKVGRLTWIAELNGNLVKICECHSEEHADFVELVTSHSRFRTCFPRHLTTSKQYLIFEWIVGEQLTWRLIQKQPHRLNEIAEIVASLHKSEIENTSLVGFDYLYDLIIPRAQRFRGIIPIDKALENLKAEIDDNTPPGPFRISHCDLSASNMIIDGSDKKIKIIDNELITANSYYLLDVFNIYHSMRIQVGNDISLALMRNFLELYLSQGGDLARLIEYRRFFISVWILRLIGSYLWSGKIGPALSLVDNYLKMGPSTHAVIQISEEIIG